jgi:hypothetical protein
MVHGDIFRVARSHNTGKGITGALLIYGDWFAQTLEGDESAVQDLFAKIERDSRHENVEILEALTVTDRVFARWAMARVSEHGDPDIPLIATKEGIVPAAPRGTTPEQERVLDMMRDVTRGFGKGY